MSNEELKRQLREYKSSNNAFETLCLSSSAKPRDEIKYLLGYIVDVSYERDEERFADIGIAIANMIELISTQFENGFPKKGITIFSGKIPKEGFKVFTAEPTYIASKDRYHRQSNTFYLENI